MIGHRAVTDGGKKLLSPLEKAGCAIASILLSHPYLLYYPD